MDRKTPWGKILVIRLGGLGDLLIALPGLALLREARPGAEFTAVCRADYGRLLKDSGLVEDIIPADAPLLTGLFREPVAEDFALRARLGEFAEVWGWMTREPGAGLALALRKHGAGNVRIVGPPPRSLPRAFYEHFFMETASALGRSTPAAGIEGKCRLLKAFRSDESGRPGEDAPQVVIHPGSGGREKCWPLERFFEIASRLSALGRGGAFVTGEAEEWMEPVMKNARFPEGWSWLRRPPLLLLAGILGRCRFYLGNDSGVTHLAAACGAPVLALFKKENAASWRPWGNVKVVSAVAVEEIKIEDAWREILSWKHAHG